MKSLPVAALVVAALIAAIAPAVRADSLDISSYSYAAVAYSEETGEMHYAYSYGSRYAAEQAALKACTAKDAKIACWVNRGFCALAVAEDGDWRFGYSHGDGSSNTEAQEYALEDFRAAGKKARIVICLSSDGQYVYKP
jgi:hypothetical protein